MKIGYDAKRAARNRTGLGNYSRFTLRIARQAEPHNEYHLYVPDMRKAPFLSEIPDLGSYICHAPEGQPWQTLGAAWRSWGVTADLNRHGIDLFHGLSNELPLNIAKARCPSVVTIHDLIFLHCPQYYKPADRAIYDYKFRRACRTATRIIAVSDYTRQEIMRYYGIAESKIDVVYQGCDPVFGHDIAQSTLQEVASRYGLPARFALYVGSIEERKNLMLAAKALKAMRSEQPAAAGMKVVAVGRRTEYCKEIERFLAENGLSDSLIMIHGVPYADLPSFYKLARFFIYPSRIEGFGIPLLEAATSSLPAIGCTGSCLEEAGGPGALYVSPDNASEAASAMAQLWLDDTLCGTMAAEGRRYAQRFGDRQLADSLFEVYRKCLR